MKKTICCCLSVLMAAVLLLGNSIHLWAEESTTQDTLPPGYYETEDFFSWLRSETDLVAFFETDRKIDGAYAEGYALRLKELYDQDSRLFISTLAGCSADAQYRAVHLLPHGYIGLQELEPFYDELLLFMAEDTWNEQEMEIVRQIEGSANLILSMYLPDSTTEPPPTEPTETVPEPTEEMTAPVQAPEQNPNTTVFWGVGLAAFLAVAIVCVYAGIKARKR